MRTHRDLLNRIAGAALLALLTFASGAPAAHAGTVDLSNTPPDLTKSVSPNIVLTFDDSGSMGNDYMGDRRPFDNKSWSNGYRSWNPWRCAAVIDPRVTDTSNIRSHAMNGVYYNPNIIYPPASYKDGSSFPNADATLASVWNDGIRKNRPSNPGSSGTTNFTGTRKEYYSTYYDRYRFSDGWRCPGDDFIEANNPLDDTSGPYYYRLKSGVTITNANGTVNTSVLYDPSNWEPVQVPASQYQNWANWWAYYRTRNLMTRTAVSRVFSKFGDNIRVVYQNINDGNYKLPANTTIGPFDDTSTDQNGNPRRTGFFNWLYQIGANGGTPDRAATIRAGKFFARKLSQSDLDPYWNGKSGSDSADLSCRQNFHMLVTDGYWNEGDPSDPAPPSGSADTTSYFTAQSARTLPDGTAYSPTDPVSIIYGNVAGTSHEPSLANIAWYYWAHDLQPTLGNNITPYFPDSSTGVTATAATVNQKDPGATPEVYWNPANDPATWQHVVQFMVTLGVAGTLDYPSDYVPLRKGQIQWPNPQNNAPEAVDDTWHAAVNSRGQFFSASNPQELVNKLIDIISNVAKRTTAETAGSLSTSVLSVGALSYTAGYDSADWSGSLKAAPLNTDGTFGTTIWDAATALTQRTSARTILTSTAPGSGNGAAFQWSTISSAEQGWLNDVPYTDPQQTDSLGQDRLKWLRGDRTNEGSEFRTRTSLLGAIVNSQPVYEAYPASGYRNYFPASASSVSPEVAAYTADPTKSYEQFVSDHADRKPMVYVGANDGMLHAFDATKDGNGKELWAYVPYSVYPELSKQMPLKNYQYVPTVDGTPVIRDVFFSENSHDEWHTILVAGLRGGGRGVYALDVTDPTAVSEATPGKTVLWEFTANSAGAKTTGVNPNDPSVAPDNPANLGYTYGQPNIGRLSNGKWVVLVPGGYFPKTTTGTSPPAASNTFSSLFVLDAQTGALIRELRTPVTVGGSTIKSYGLGSPVLGDYNDDQIDDVAFAGDLEGNLWRFDLSDPNPANWSVDLVYKPTTAGAQPITVMPRLFPDPATGKFMVVFGTGKFLGLSDRTNSSAPVQSIYGIRDPGASGTGTVWTRSDLVQQTLYEATDGSGARALTNNPVPAAKGGWYIDLNLSGSKGERVVTTPGALFNTNRVIVATLIPGTNDPCDPSRKGAIMVIDATNGGAGQGIDFPSWGGRPTGTAVIGGRADNLPTGGSLPVATPVGGGKVYLPGISLLGGQTFSAGDSIWRRRSWRTIDVNK